MKRFKTGLRAIASVAVKAAAKVTVFGVLCLLLTSNVFLMSNAPAIAANTYSDVQRSQLEKFKTPLLTAQERMAELGQYVVAEDWTNTRNFIHGPLGELRRYMANVSRNLLPKEQRQSRKQAKELMFHIEQLDGAAQDENARIALREYKETVSELDEFLQLIPQF